MRITRRAAIEVPEERFGAACRDERIGKKAGTVRERIPENWVCAAPARLPYTFVRSVVAAAGKLFWYDGLPTQVLAAQGSLQRIVDALMGPTDRQPLLFYALEK